MRLAVLRPRGATCLCAGAASIELTVLAIGSTPPTGAWLLDGPAARRSWAASCAASAASSAVLELDAPAIHPARSGNTGCFSAHTPGDAPTCVLRHQLSSERRIVLLLQPLHERQALSIRVRGCGVRGCGQPARRRRTSCAHAAGRRRRSCAPCWQWTKLLACEESDAPRIAVARNHGQSERQPGVITIERSSENQQRPYSTTALHI